MSTVRVRGRNGGNRTKRLICGILSILLVSTLFGCAQNEAALTWQEQYDLGVRYLSEGNYEQAVIAFTAAIEIDLKRPDCLYRSW